MGSKVFEYSVNVVSCLSDYLRQNVKCLSKPNISWIEPTNICNLRCPMCPATHFSSNIGKGFMDLGVFQRIVDEIADFTLESFLLLGGEPLLHKNISQMVEYQTARDVQSQIHTNGTILTNALSRDLIQAGLSFISFSFDGYDKATYESVRVNARFEKTVENILEFLRIKAKRGQSIPFVSIKCIVPRRTDPRFDPLKRDQFRSLFAGLPVDEFIEVPVHNWSQDLPSSQVLDLPGFEPIEWTVENLRKFHPCQRLWTTLSILWDGTVVPCCADFMGDYPLGNVKEKSILEVWNDGPMRALRDRHLHRELDMKPCRGCTFPMGKAVLGVPLHFYGPASILKRISYPIYRQVYRKLGPSF